MRPLYEVGTQPVSGGGHACAELSGSWHRAQIVDIAAAQTIDQGRADKIAELAFAGHGRSADLQDRALAAGIGRYRPYRDQLQQQQRCGYDQYEQQRDLPAELPWPCRQRSAGGHLGRFGGFDDRLERDPISSAGNRQP